MYMEVKVWFWEFLLNEPFMNIATNLEEFKRNIISNTKVS